MRVTCVVRSESPPHRGVLGAGSLFNGAYANIYLHPREVFISESIQFVIVFVLFSIFFYSGYFCYLVTFLFYCIHCFVAFPLCKNIFLPFLFANNNNDDISTEMIFSLL